MKILITGGSGFIAQNLYTYFHKKYCVTKISRQDFDLTDEGAVSTYLSTNKFDLIIQCAVYDGLNKYTTKSKDQILQQNLNIFFNFVKCKDLFGRMICFGSGAEYIKDNPYGFYQYIVTQYAQLVDYITVLRLFGVYGPYEDWRIRFISNACCRAINNLPIIIHKERLMNYLYVEDLCKIIDVFISNNRQHNIYNVCHLGELLLTEIATFVNSLNNTKCPVIVMGEGQDLDYVGNNSQMMNEFGHLINFTSPRDGITKLYQWYVDNPASYDIGFLKRQTDEYLSIL